MPACQAFLTSHGYTVGPQATHWCQVGTGPSYDDKVAYQIGLQNLLVEAYDAIGACEEARR